MMEWIVGAAILAVAYYIWSRPRARRDLAQEAPRMPGPGSFDYEVVGERSYQPALEKLAGGRTEDSADIECVAVLIPETDNPHDKNAVRVEIRGLTVGYLPRDFAKRYRRYLRHHNQPLACISCNALITGGWDRGFGDKGYFGVRLDMPDE